MEQPNRQEKWSSLGVEASAEDHGLGEGWPSGRRCKKMHPRSCFRGKGCEDITRGGGGGGHSFLLLGVRWVLASELGSAMLRSL